MLKRAIEKIRASWYQRGWVYGLKRGEIEFTLPDGNALHIKTCTDKSLATLVTDEATILKNNVIILAIDDDKTLKAAGVEHAAMMLPLEFVTHWEEFPLTKHFYDDLVRDKGSGHIASYMVRVSTSVNFGIALYDLLGQIQTSFSGQDVHLEAALHFWLVNGFRVFCFYHPSLLELNYPTAKNRRY